MLKDYRIHCWRCHAFLGRVERTDGLRFEVTDVAAKSLIVITLGKGDSSGYPEGSTYIRANCATCHTLGGGSGGIYMLADPSQPIAGGAMARARTRARWLAAMGSFAGFVLLTQAAVQEQSVRGYLLALAMLIPTSFLLPVRRS